MLMPWLILGHDPHTWPTLVDIHFIPMAMEVHNIFRHDMDRFIRERVRFFHDKQSRGYLSLFFFLHLVFQAMCQYCFLACFSLYYGKKDVFLNLLLLLDLMICMKATLERLWVK